MRLNLLQVGAITGQYLTGQPPSDPREKGLWDRRFKNPASAKGWDKRRENLLRRLAAILDPAFRDLDPKPILRLLRGIEVLRNVTQGTPVSPLERNILVVALERDLLLPEMEPQPSITRAQFADSLCRERAAPSQGLRAVGDAVQTGQAGQAEKTPDNS